VSDKKFRVVDYDIIYLSYDEPNAEKNYADLLTKVPWAKRIHGVKGSDAAHKACAEISETDRFITVDGDNIVHADFLNVELDFSENEYLEKAVISWCGKNIINDLMYGNGGLKCWPREYVLSMRTHENADPDNAHAQVDFCWDVEYIQMNECFSTVYNNATSQQAWRAGFREGVKMALNQGVKPTVEEFYENHWRCLHWLYIWMMVGSDVEHGDWANLGARAGLYKTMCTDWNYVQVRDFDYLNNLWDEEFVDFEGHEVYDESCNYTKLLSQNLNIPVADPLSAGQSKFFKSVYKSPPRIDKGL